LHIVLPKRFGTAPSSAQNTTLRDSGLGLGTGRSHLNVVVRQDGAGSLPLQGGGWRPTGPAFGRPDDRLRRRVGVPSRRRICVRRGTPTRPASWVDPWVVARGQALFLSGGGIAESAVVWSN